MHTLSEENYLKIVYFLELSEGAKASPTTIAETLGNSPASVVDMLKKLRGKKLIQYDKSRGARLTETGKRTALGVVRNHRLWEVFLHEKLGYSWDEVHPLAEQLEHVHDPLLADRLDKYLGFPQYDPHGDPIPKQDGKIARLPRTTLTGITPGNTCRVVAVKDTSAPFLQYLAKLNIGIGTQLKVEEFIAYDGSLTIKLDRKTATVSKKFAESIIVDNVKSLTIAGRTARE
jgi:DtxR family Mn-dependent transcriptional regulator